MSNWAIEDLDKNKTEQSIVNESIRLDNCKKTLKKLRKEYEEKRYFFIHCVLSDIEDKISTLENSIESGEKYINKCKEHLKDFENEKV